VALRLGGPAILLASSSNVSSCKTGKGESKFGMNTERVERVAHQVTTMSKGSMISMHMHIGSQITSTEPYVEAVAKGVELIEKLRNQGDPIGWFNMGGGYGTNYRETEARSIQEFAAVIAPAVQAAKCRLAIEPGRVVVGNAGIFVSRVIYTKRSGDKRFLIQDAAMNDLIRPALYEAFHRILPANLPTELRDARSDAELVPAGAELWDVVGPVCESGDFLAKDRPLPALNRGALVATFSAGAYGMVMGSNYNGRPCAAEILGNRSTVRVVCRQNPRRTL
jgi:diaminopimelate decarboxylase